MSLDPKLYLVAVDTLVLIRRECADGNEGMAVIEMVIGLIAAASTANEADIADAVSKLDQEKSKEAFKEFIKGMAVIRAREPQN